MPAAGDERPAGEELDTRAVQDDADEREPGSPVVPPLVQSATFHGWGPGGGARRYSRMGNNPNQERIARKVAALEGTGAALMLSSGMAATATTLLALTRTGDHVVASRDLYGATRRLLADELPRRGVETTLVDPGAPGAWDDALRPETRAVFLEIPANPTLRVYDPGPPADAAREAGAHFVVDATFASPVNLRMAKHGADLVVHSATKYLGGHSDLVAGVVAGDADRIERIRETMILYGPAPDPHAAWLLDRGLRTLPLRVRRQNDTALRLARWLTERPAVRRVVHPGLPDHPDHEVARRILDGYGGMLAFVLDGGGPAADAFMEALRTARVAPSLGGVETLVSQPRYTSHVEMTPEEREAAGIPDGFVRVSVGVEGVDDLREDFDRALGAAGR